jgi:N4-gp56 family major capsid protein
MSGQLWSTPALGGYMYSDNLSRELRTALQPMTRFRQFCDVREAFGLGKGETFVWNIYGDVADSGQELSETETMPETNFTIEQNTLTIKEFGNSVPFTKKLDDLSEHPITEIIHKVLKNDARKVIEAQAYAQFLLSPLTATSTSATAFTLTTNGTHSGAATHALTNEHVKGIADTMAERNLPTFDGTHYMGVGRPTALRTFKNDLEGIHQYTSEGWQVIMNGEKGRYEGIRFVEQTAIAAAGFTNTDRVFFFGQDTVVEAMAIPEEIRGKIPTDFGRARGIAWYAELGYGLVHDNATQARIIRWGSTT